MKPCPTLILNMTPVTVDRCVDQVVFHAQWYLHYCFKRSTSNAELGECAILSWSSIFSDSWHLGLHSAASDNWQQQRPGLVRSVNRMHSGLPAASCVGKLSTQWKPMELSLAQILLVLSCFVLCCVVLYGCTQTKCVHPWPSTCVHVSCFLCVLWRVSVASFCLCFCIHKCNVAT